MALPPHLMDELLRLPERDRVALAEALVADVVDRDGDVPDVDALIDVLGRSDAHVAAGRTRPMADLVAELRAEQSTK